jgi:hypothetical protein
MSNEEMEQLLDENQRIKTQRKWAIGALALAAVLVACGTMRGRNEPKADAERHQPVIAVPSVTRRMYSPPVAPLEEPATPRPQEQPVTPEQDQPETQAPAAATNDAAAPQAMTQPQAATPPAPTAPSQKWQSFSGSLSIGGGGGRPGSPYAYRGYAAPYAAPLRGGWYRPMPLRPAPFRPTPLRPTPLRPAPYRGGFRAGPAPFHAAPAPFRSAPSSGGVRSFGGGRRR